MIRRKVSNGLLRAATATQSASTTSGSTASHAVASSPMQQQTANLASSVLLSSQRNWKGETVVTLKNELKKRGLSQTGNKTTLVARLSSAEASQLLPPMPKSLQNARNISTTSSRSAAASKSDSKSTPAPAPKQEDTATINGSKEMTTGPEISSKTAEAEAFEEPTKEQLNASPGLPESGKVESSSAEKLSVKMPGPPSEEPTVQTIPLEPDNFRSNEDLPEAEQKDKSDDVPSPKVMTVASASTHLSGGPVSAVHESTDSSTQDAQEKKSKDNSGSDEPSFEGAGKALASAFNSLTGVGKTTSEFTRVFIPEIHLPKSSGGGGEYKPPKGGLDHEERRGLWVLGGIVGLGLVLGGSGKREKNGSGLGDKIGEAVDAAKGVKGGPKGDKEWEKASGAEIVGHGARKE